MPTTFPRARRSPATRVGPLGSVVLLVGMVALALTGPLPGADAAAKAKATKKATVTLGQLRQTQLAREKVRSKRAKAAAKVDALRASRKRVTAALDALNSNVRVTSVALDRARRSAAAATARAANAREREKAVRKRLDELQSQRLEGAMRTYADPSGTALDLVLSSGDASVAGRREVIDAMSKQRNAEILDELVAIEQDLAILRRMADKAEKQAHAQRAAVSRQLSSYKSARSQQIKFARTVESRLEAQLAESASLSRIDAQLAAQIASENAALAKRLRSAGAGALAKGRFTVSDIATAGGGDTHGIRVAPSIRGRLAAMLAAAQADGIYFTGGGYRSSSQQVALRMAHCGSSTYAIYSAPSSACRPPTARPGASMHERGLAVDFSENGGGALRRGSRGFAWLRANAHRFGFFNLPSEPWHWSVNGN